MKLTYWYAERQDDSDCYSIRTRTKREAVAHKAEYDHATYGPIVKVTVEYANAFDLMSHTAGEGGLWEEAEASLNEQS